MPETPIGPSPLILPVLRGERVCLRAFTHDDLGVVLDAATDPFHPDRHHGAGHAGPRTRRSVHRPAARPGRHRHGLLVRDRRRDGRGRRADRPVAARHRSRPREHRLLDRHAADALRTVSAWGERLPAEAAGYQREGLLRSWERVGPERRDMFVYRRIA